MEAFRLVDMAINKLEAQKDIGISKTIMDDSLKSKDTQTNKNPDMEQSFSDTTVIKSKESSNNLSFISNQKEGDVSIISNLSENKSFTIAVYDENSNLKNLHPKLSSKLSDSPRKLMEKANLYDTETFYMEYQSKSKINNNQLNDEVEELQMMIIRSNNERMV